METNNCNQIFYRYFFVQQVIEPHRSENITSDIKEKSRNKVKWIDLVQDFYDIAGGNLRKENSDKKKGDNDRGDFYKCMPTYVRK
jgi:hypothetical protein